MCPRDEAAQMQQGNMRAVEEFERHTEQETAAQQVHAAAAGKLQRLEGRIAQMEQAHAAAQAEYDNGRAGALNVSCPARHVPHAFPAMSKKYSRVPACILRSSMLCRLWVGSLHSIQTPQQAKLVCSLPQASDSWRPANLLHPPYNTCP